MWLHPKDGSILGEKSGIKIEEQMKQYGKIAVWITRWADA